MRIFLSTENPMFSNPNKNQRKTAKITEMQDLASQQYKIAHIYDYIREYTLILTNIPYSLLILNL